MAFFNRATNAVETMGRNVSRVAKDNMEIMKCSAAIESCEEKINHTYQEIGKRYYNTAGDVSREAFKDLFEEIQFNVRQRDELRSRLRTLKGVETCKKCGAEIKKGMKFCQWCGERVEQTPMALGGSDICPNCGTQLKGGERFCAFCGAEIELIEPVYENSQSMRCSVCGEQLKDTDLFCQYCGNPVKREMKSAEGYADDMENIENINENIFTEDER